MYYQGMEPKKRFASTETPSADRASMGSTSSSESRRETAPDTGSPHIGRRSTSNQQSSPGSHEPLSCAPRNSFGENSARRKLIVWAAMKRDTSVRVEMSERLRCPFSRCREQIEDYDAMLRHLPRCKHLETGEHVCHDCMKVQRYNDPGCGRCPGYITKRRRMINMAKRLFISIVSIRRRQLSTAKLQTDLVLPPPSSVSRIVDICEQNEQDELERRWRIQKRQFEAQEDQRSNVESKGMELWKLDWRPLLPAAEHNTVKHNDLLTGSPNSPYAMNAFTDAVSTSILMGASDSSSCRLKPASNLLPSLRSRDALPSLTLDTRMARYRNSLRRRDISPNSSLRSSKSSWNVSPSTPWSTSSWAWTMDSNIDTTLISPTSPLGANSYSTLLTTDHVSFNTKGTGICPKDPCEYYFDGKPKLPGDDLLSMDNPEELSNSFLFSFSPMTNYSRIVSFHSELFQGTSVNMMFSEDSSKHGSLSSHFLGSTSIVSETKVLVASAWEALQQHFNASDAKLATMIENPLAQRLRAQTARTVAINGLSVLRNILNGNDPADPLAYLCFIHLMYALSFVLHEDDAMIRNQQFYNQALAYSSFLDPADIPYYSQIVVSMWDLNQDNQLQGQAGTLPSLKGKEPAYRTHSTSALGSDPMVIVGQTFLDDIESSVSNSDPHTQKPIEVLTSELWSMHVAEFQTTTTENSSFAMNSDYVLTSLMESFRRSESLLFHLREISQRVHAGYISYNRKLELEILQSGKGTLISADFFDEFVPRVRGLCDQVYSQREFQSRTRYQSSAVLLVENMLKSISHPPLESQHTQAPFPVNPHPSFDNFLENFDETFHEPSGLDDDFIIQNAPMQQMAGASTVPTFDLAVYPTSFTPTTPSAPLSMPTSRPFTLPSHPRLPSEPLPIPSMTSPSIQQPIIVPARPKSATPAVLVSMNNEARAASLELSGRASPSSSSAPGPKVEANDCCEICGYRPRGDPQWFKGSMAKHKKMQHSTEPPMIYKCPFPGCSSQYKNRADNLRQHQIEKNHFVGDEAAGRPNKRKKTLKTTE